MYCAFLGTAIYFVDSETQLLHLLTESLTGIDAHLAQTWIILTVLFILFPTKHHFYIVLRFTMPHENQSHI